MAVLVPCYNEAVTIGKVIDDFHRCLPGATVYVYDNNSTDDTATIARSHGAVVRTERRQGKGHTVRQMLRDIDADAYLMVDGDDTYPAEAAPDLLNPLLDGEVDFSLGDRLSNGTYEHENKRAFHNLGNNLVRTLIRHLYGVSYTDVMTGYRGFTRLAARTLPILSPGFELETELAIHTADKRWRVAEIPIDYRDRPAGSISKLNTLSDGLRVLRTIAGLFKDYRPFAFFGWLSLLLAILGIAVAIPVIGEYLSTGLVPRLPTAFLASALEILAALSLTTALILDTIAKNSRKQYELAVLNARR
ncbi:glycosyltransferase [Bifidobacterium pullorum subsp. saeculare]|uniref:Glycosyltransferase n=1 Tax=Bifidobacterium pullorum subsp. saeculare TaxID=78257 RepID=A0A938WZ02_9BIFI|nr:glycosyltransferase [Bifidobacterium pullorum subsp. saeculare]